MGGTEVGAFCEGLGEGYVSRRWRARSVEPSPETVGRLPVEIMVESDGTDCGPLYVARSVEPVEPVRRQDDDSLVDPQGVVEKTSAEEVLSEGSDLDARTAADRLRSQVIRTLALPREFHKKNEVVRVISRLSLGESTFDPAQMDAPLLIGEHGPFGCRSIDAIAAVNAHLGAGLFDSVNTGWHEVVDPDTVDQQRELWCVLAQLYGTYHNGLLELEDFLRVSPLNFGFDMDPGVEGFQTSRYYEYLTLCWQYQIRTRLF